MKTRPILFAGEMVRAILDGRKTQTRRMVKPQPIPYQKECLDGHIHSGKPWMPVGGVFQDAWECPFGTVGDRLWVRETWQCVPVGRPAPLCGSTKIPESIPDGHTVLYSASGDECTKNVGWRPSIHMPRWASRITLEITAVRVERLQEITEEDAKKEGVIPLPSAEIAARVFKDTPHRMEFYAIWQSIYSNRPKLPPNPESKRYQRVKRWLDKHPAQDWDANPWVWVVEFKRV